MPLTNNETPRVRTGALAVGECLLPNLKPQAQHSMRHLCDAGGSLVLVFSIIEAECDPQRLADARKQLELALAMAVHALVNDHTKQGGAS